jgi:uncharacterized membrane protein
VIGGQIMANAALVLGILSLFTWLLPLLGFPIIICGIVISIIALARKDWRNGKSVAGLVMAVIGFVLTLVNYILGALMVMQVF